MGEIQSIRKASRKVQMTKFLVQNMYRFALDIFFVAKLQFS
jgi:hypothetical protein